MRRKTLAAIIFATGILASHAYAQQTTRGGDVVQHTAPRAPAARRSAQDYSTTSNAQTQVREARFIVEATRFQAIDETSWHPFGSDEVATLLTDLTTSTPGQSPTAVTSTTGDIDSGDIGLYGLDESCVMPRRVIRDRDDDGWLQSPRDAWNCDRAGVKTVRFQVTLFEIDRSILICNFLERDEAPTPETFAVCHEDLIGNADVSHSYYDLLERLPEIGDSFTRGVRLDPCWPAPAGNACGVDSEYRFEYRVTRVADAIVSRPTRARD